MGKLHLLNNCMICLTTAATASLHKVPGDLDPQGQKPDGLIAGSSRSPDGAPVQLSVERQHSPVRNRRIIKAPKWSPRGIFLPSAASPWVLRGVSPANLLRVSFQEGSKNRDEQLVKKEKETLCGPSPARKWQLQQSRRSEPPRLSEGTGGAGATQPHPLQEISIGDSIWKKQSQAAGPKRHSLTPSISSIPPHTLQTLFIAGCLGRKQPLVHRRPSWELEQIGPAGASVGAQQSIQGRRLDHNLKFMMEEREGKLLPNGWLPRKLVDI